MLFGSPAYLGEFAGAGATGDALALAHLQARKWDSLGTGLGTAQEGHWYANTTDHQPRHYLNGAWGAGVVLSAAGVYPAGDGSLLTNLPGGFTTIYDADLSGAAGTDVANAGTITQGVGYKTFAIANGVNGDWTHGTFNGPLRWYAIPPGNFLISAYYTHIETSATDYRQTLIGAYCSSNANVFQRATGWIASSNKGCGLTHDQGSSVTEPSYYSIHNQNSRWFAMARIGGVFLFADSANAAGSEPAVKDWVDYWSFSGAFGTNMPRLGSLRATNRVFVGAINANAYPITEARISNLRIQAL